MKRLARSRVRLLPGPQRTVRARLDVTVSRELAVTGPPGTAVTRVARLVLRSEGVRRATVSITLVSDATIRRLNARYLGHRRPTDVIAFALPAPDGAIAGDVYIAPGVAARAAIEHAIPLREEVLRLVVHAVLHLLGYDHPAGPSRTRSVMWRRQEALLARALAEGAA